MRDVQVTNGAEHDKPSRERKDLAKQLGKYADATTAFVVIQSIAFSFSLGSKELGERIRHAPAFLIETLCYIVLAFYILIITSCFVGENKLFGKESRTPILAAGPRLFGVGDAF